MTVADARGRKWDAATGIGFAVFAIVGLVLPGSPPKADDTASSIASYFADKHSELLTGSLLLGVAAVLFLWWLGTLRSYLRSGEGGEGRLSAAAFGAGVSGISLILAGAAIFSGVAFKLADGQTPDPTVTRAIFDSGSAVLAMPSFAFAAFFAAASCSGARSGALPPWAYWTGSVIAVLQLLGGLALVAKRGFLAV